MFCALSRTCTQPGQREREEAHLFNEVSGTNVDDDVFGVLELAGYVERARERDQDGLFCARNSFRLLVVTEAGRGGWRTISESS